METTLTV